MVRSKCVTSKHWLGFIWSISECSVGRLIDVVRRAEHDAIITVDAGQGSSAHINRCNAGRLVVNVRRCDDVASASNARHMMHKFKYLFIKRNMSQ